MRGKVAKRLRRKAEGLTVGKSLAATKKLYKQLKKAYKS